MTVFRRFQNKKGLIEVVIAREIRGAMEELDRGWERGQTLEERLVLGFALVARVGRGHPLFNRLLRSAPDFLLPLITVDGGPALELYRSLSPSDCTPRRKLAASDRFTSTAPLKSSRGSRNR